MVATTARRARLHPAWVAAAVAGVTPYGAPDDLPVDNPGSPLPRSATLPVRGPTPGQVGAACLCLVAAFASSRVGRAAEPLSP